MALDYRYETKITGAKIITDMGADDFVTNARDYYSTRRNQDLYKKRIKHIDLAKSGQNITFLKQLHPAQTALSAVCISYPEIVIFRSTDEFDIIGFTVTKYPIGQLINNYYESTAIKLDHTASGDISDGISGLYKKNGSTTWKVSIGEYIRGQYFINLDDTTNGIRTFDNLQLADLPIYGSRDVYGSVINFLLYFSESIGREFNFRFKYKEVLYVESGILRLAIHDGNYYLAKISASLTNAERLQVYNGPADIWFIGENKATELTSADISSVAYTVINPTINVYTYGYVSEDNITKYYLTPPKTLSYPMTVILNNPIHADIIIESGFGAVYLDGAVCDTNRVNLIYETVQNYAIPNTISHAVVNFVPNNQSAVDIFIGSSLISKKYQVLNNIALRRLITDTSETRTELLERRHSGLWDLYLNGHVDNITVDDFINNIVITKLTATCIVVITIATPIVNPLGTQINIISTESGLNIYNSLTDVHVLHVSSQVVSVTIKFSLVIVNGVKYIEINNVTDSILNAPEVENLIYKNDIDQVGTLMVRSSSHKIIVNTPIQTLAVPTDETFTLPIEALKIATPADNFNITVGNFDESVTSRTFVINNVPNISGAVSTSFTINSGNDFQINIPYGLHMIESIVKPTPFDYTYLINLKNQFNLTSAQDVLPIISGDILLMNWIQYPRINPVITPESPHTYNFNFINMNSAAEDCQVSLKGQKIFVNSFYVDTVDNLDNISYGIPYLPTFKYASISNDRAMFTFTQPIWRDGPALIAFENNFIHHLIRLDANVAVGLNNFTLIIIEVDEVDYILTIRHGSLYMPSGCTCTFNGVQIGSNLAINLLPFSAGDDPRKCILTMHSTINTLNIKSYPYKNNFMSLNI